MKRLTLLLISHIAAICAVAEIWTVENLPNVQRTARTKHLVNPDGIVTPLTQSRIDSLLLDARRKTSAEIVAVMIDDFDGDDIDEFATDLFNSWRIGKGDNDNGILIVVAKDRKRATIRTGYGAEGVLPDIVAGRILRDTMFPKFRHGDFGGGLLAGVQKVHDIVIDPTAADELRSDQDENTAGVSDIEFFPIYIKISVSVAALMLLLLVILLWNNRKKTPYEKYKAMVPMRSWALVMSAICLFVPLVAVVPYLILLNRWRNGVHKCPKCRTKMQKVDEVHDNDFLSPTQDTEERLNSVDYDVWLCPSCGETEILPYRSQLTNYQPCPQCGGLTCSLIKDQIILNPTTSRDGKGMRVYHCQNCTYEYTKYYDIAKLPTPLVIPGGGRGGSGFGGGGFSGGGFGGGLTGGGGASGGW